MHIIALCGSLRRGSFNRALLVACVELAPAGMTIEVRTVDGVPLFNEDDEAQGAPEAVARLREAIGAADGLLVATPEYNAGVPGVLKNALDWLSRPPGKSALRSKPVAILGTSPGVLGTARAQAHLRASFEFNACPVMPSPQVFVGMAREKFDADLRLTDEKTRAFLAKHLEAFATWVQRNGPPKG
jgi:chromate reductase